jgi:CBS domain-containing protein
LVAGHTGAGCVSQRRVRAADKKARERSYTMLVKDLMTPAPVYCKASDSVARVAKLMAEHDCGCIPVCEGTKVIGIITDRDVTTRVVAARKNPELLPVTDVMTRTVYTVSEDQDADAAIDMMKTAQVRRLPVLDDDDELVGIIAPSDLAPTMASHNVADFLLSVSYWTRPAPA